MSAGAESRHASLQLVARPLGVPAHVGGNLLERTTNRQVKYDALLVSREGGVAVSRRGHNRPTIRGPHFNSLCRLLAFPPDRTSPLSFRSAKHHSLVSLNPAEFPGFNWWDILSVRASAADGGWSVMAGQESGFLGDLGSRMRTVRLARHRTVRQAAGEAGISVGYWHELETAKKRNPALSKIQKIVRWLESPPE